MRRKISWTDGRTDRGKTVYPPTPSGSGGIINEMRNWRTGWIVGYFLMPLSTTFWYLDSQLYRWQELESMENNTHLPQDTDLLWSLHHRLFTSLTNFLFFTAGSPSPSNPVPVRFILWKSSNSLAFFLANSTTFLGKCANSATCIPKLWSQTPEKDRQVQ